MRSVILPAPLLLVAMSVLAVPGRASELSRREEVHAAIDAWHRAAARADEERYFATFTKGAVFLGTDASERWTRDDFRKWAHPHFLRGRAWTLVPLERHLAFSPRSDIAWFDEALQSRAYGRCRGSGVAILEDGAWKIAQYNFSVPIPNPLLGEFVKRIRGKN